MVRSFPLAGVLVLLLGAAVQKQAPAPPAAAFPPLKAEDVSQPDGWDADLTLPKPADLKTVGNAQLILVSAKHLEGYVGKLQEATGAKGKLVEVGDRFPSLKMKTDDDHDHAHDHAHDRDRDAR